MKKMRRMIPALCMLLVSAIMLSTASFAWFTMNENVTATGMQVKAKAAGNLLISANKMTAADQAISITFTDSGKKDIQPVTFGKLTDDAEDKTWIVPSEGKDVDPTYGTYAGDFEAISAGAVGSNSANATYFAEYVMYLATAGEVMNNQKLSMTLTGLAGVDQAIAPAYSVAVWVGTNADVNAPDANYNYKDFLEATDTKGELVIKESGVTIPSTFEKTSEDPQGLKVVVRIYVDGNLKKGDTTITPLAKLTPDAETEATWADFKDNHDDLTKYVFYVNGAVVDTTYWEADHPMTGVEYTDGVTNGDPITQEIKYVNNGNIPTSSTTFEIEFTVVEVTPAQGGGEG